MTLPNAYTLIIGKITEDDPTTTPTNQSYHLHLFSLASTGKPKTTSRYQTTIADARWVSIAICATDGKNNTIIRRTIKLSNARQKDARKGLVPTIIHRRKEELWKMIS